MKRHVRATIEGAPPAQRKRIRTPRGPDDVRAAMRRLRAARGSVHPSVQAAEAQTLINAGWGAYDRTRIPADWRTRRPGNGSGV